MSTEPIVLFDLPSREPYGAWSLNPWKVRLLLNYKGLDYTTEWTEYPDIKPKFEPHVPPNETGMPYTIPTVKFANGTHIMESSNIAEAIEKMAPEPCIHLDSPYRFRVQDLTGHIAGAVRPVFLTRVPKRLLNDESLDYWHATRFHTKGTSIEQFEKDNPIDDTFRNAEPHLQEMTSILKENDGPFFMGNTVSWADFIWVGFLVFFQRIGDDVFQRVLDGTGDREVHLEILRAASPWLERHAH